MRLFAFGYYFFLSLDHREAKKIDWIGG